MSSRSAADTSETTGLYTGTPKNLHQSRFNRGIAGSGTTTHRAETGLGVGRSRALSPTHLKWCIHQGKCTRPVRLHPEGRKLQGLERGRISYPHDRRSTTKLALLSRRASKFGFLQSDQEGTKNVTFSATKMARTLTCCSSETLIFRYVCANT